MLGAYRSAQNRAQSDGLPILGQASRTFTDRSSHNCASDYHSLLCILDLHRSRFVRLAELTVALHPHKLPDPALISRTPRCHTSTCAAWKLGAYGTNPKTNYGAFPQLVVTQGATTFIQFNLLNLPANATVSKATLRLYVDAVTRNGSFEIDTTWTEGALNFTNAPTPGLSVTGTHPTAIAASNVNQFILVDITSLVQEWVNGTVANNGVALKLTTSTGSFSFDSKESPLTGHEPELEVTLAETGPQGPQGPAGPQGPQGPTGPQGVSANLVPGSPLYVQNGATTQGSASFNIDGNGTVGGALAGQTVNSAKGYQIGGVTELNADGKVNLMIGQSAGNATISGSNSQLIGDSAGASLTSGHQCADEIAARHLSLQAGVRQGRAQSTIWAHRGRSRQGVPGTGRLQSRWHPLHGTLPVSFQHSVGRSAEAVPPRTGAGSAH